MGVNKQILSLLLFISYVKGQLHCLSQNLIINSPDGLVEPYTTGSTQYGNVPLYLGNDIINASSCRAYKLEINTVKQITLESFNNINVRGIVIWDYLNDKYGYFVQNVSTIFPQKYSLNVNLFTCANSKLIAVNPFMIVQSNISYVGLARFPDTDLYIGDSVLYPGTCSIGQEILLKPCLMWTLVRKINERYDYDAQFKCYVDNMLPSTTKITTTVTSSTSFTTASTSSFTNTTIQSTLKSLHTTGTKPTLSETVTINNTVMPTGTSNKITYNILNILIQFIVSASIYMNY